MMDAHSSSDIVRAGNAYSIDFNATCVNVVQDSCLSRCPVRIYSASFFVFSLNFFTCVSLEPSGARNTPSISSDWFECKYFSCCCIPSLSLHDNDSAVIFSKFP